jgi:hypothetical protein
VALRGAGLAWIVMGLLTLLAAWLISDYDTSDAWWEWVSVRIKITVPVLMLELVFGLALICAGIFAWSCARWAAYAGLGLGYLWLVGAIVLLLPVFPPAVLSLTLGHRALWLANPRRRRGDAASTGMGGGGSRRADWIAAAVTCLAIGPVAGVLLGLVFGWLVTAFMEVARQRGSTVSGTDLQFRGHHAANRALGSILGVVTGGFLGAACGVAIPGAMAFAFDRIIFTQAPESFMQGSWLLLMVEPTSWCDAWIRGRATMTCNAASTSSSWSSATFSSRRKRPGAVA